jgi:hypothetical protein
MRRSVDAFFDVHLDPTCDPPPHERALFDLLGELWAELHTFRASVDQEPVLRDVAAYLQRQLVAAALVLSIKMNMIDASKQE